MRIVEIGRLLRWLDARWYRVPTIVTIAGLSIAGATGSNASWIAKVLLLVAGIAAIGLFLGPATRELLGAPAATFAAVSGGYLALLLDSSSDPASDEVTTVLFAFLTAGLAGLIARAANAYEQRRAHSDLVRRLEDLADRQAADAETLRQLLERLPAHRRGHRWWRRFGADR